MSALLGLNVADHIKLTLEIVIEKQKKWFKDELEVMKVDTGNRVTEKSFFFFNPTRINFAGSVVDPE